jgi:hypothetical protein
MIEVLKDIKLRILEKVLVKIVEQMDIKRNNVPKDRAKLEQNLLRRIFNPMMLLKRYN